MALRTSISTMQLPGLAPLFAPTARPAGADPAQAAGGLAAELGDLDSLLKPFRKPRGNWADAAALIGGALMDLDGTLGSGHMAAAQARWADHVEEARQAHAEAQQQAILKRAAMGDDLALGLLDPIGNREFQREGQWREEDIAREGQWREEDIARDEGWKLRDYLFSIFRTGKEQDNWEREFDEGRRQFDATLGLRQDELGLEALKAQLDQADKAPTQEGQVRREYLAQNADFLDMQRAIGKIRAIDTSTAAGQMGLIFNLMKLYDPGSTVREGEFASAENARGVPDTIVNTYNKLLDGEFLTDDQIRDFRATADSLYDAARQDYERSFRTYRDTVAPGYGFDPDRTVPDLRDPALMLGSFRTPAGQAIPTAAVRELLSNPTRQEMDEFDQTFGQGVAEEIFGTLGLAVPERVVPRTYDVPR